MLTLLEKVKIINKYQKQISDLSDDKFNMFRICGVNHYEVTHSSILTELLSSDSSHSFGTKFLQSFIETLKRNNIIDEDYNFPLINIKVIPEFSINSLGRIDIMIKNENQCIIIENKIYAGDQFEQLKRYDQYARNNYKDYQLLYLTLWGDEASEQSSLNINYKQISYSNTIIDWLEKCIQISARSPIIRETLIQYVNHIKYLTNNTSSMKMNEEFIELLSKEENIEALFTIGERLNDVRNHLINKTLIPQLTAVSEELNIINSSEEGDRINKAWSSFNFTPPNWKFYRVGFEFEAKNLRNLMVGIYHKDPSIKNENTFNLLKPSFKKNNDNWVWSDFPKYNNYWGKDAMVAISNGEMANIFRSEIEKILELTKDLDM